MIHRSAAKLVDLPFLAFPWLNSTISPSDLCFSIKFFRQNRANLAFPSSDLKFWVCGGTTATGGTPSGTTSTGTVPTSRASGISRELPVLPPQSAVPPLGLLAEFFSHRFGHNFCIRTPFFGDSKCVGILRTRSTSPTRLLHHPLTSKIREQGWNSMIKGQDRRNEGINFANLFPLAFLWCTLPTRVVHFVVAKLCVLDPAKRECA